MADIAFSDEVLIHQLHSIYEGAMLFGHTGGSARRSAHGASVLLLVLVVVAERYGSVNLTTERSRDMSWQHWMNEMQSHPVIVVVSPPSATLVLACDFHAHQLRAV